MKLQAIIKTFSIVSIFSFVLFTTTCGSKKTVTSDGTLAEKSHRELITDILDSELNYRTISAKMNLELLPANSKKSLKTGTNVKLIKDSILQISIRPIFGIEVFRLSLTPDSVYVLDRQNKKYAVESIKSLQKSQGAYFNFYNLQALFTNNLFVPGKRELNYQDIDNFDVSISSGMYLLKTKDDAGLLYNFAVDASDKIQSTLIFSPGNEYTLQWSYDDFIKDGRYIYPTTMEAKAGIKGKRFDVNISYSKLDINQNTEIDMSVSDKYDRIPLMEIIRAYIKL